MAGSAYDRSCHLLGEYDGAGSLIQETLWLGDIPVATLRPNGFSVAIYYVETDQLDTPRAVIRSSGGALMWTWFTGPFGVEAPNTNPQGAGAFAYDLRLPGQIAGSWGGAFQNDNRDYDPAVGRYVEPDPLGLAGGSYSTYAYALGNPLFWADPLGLNVTMTCRPLSMLTRMGRAAPEHCGVIVWHWIQDCPPRKIIDRQFSIAGFTERPTTDPNNSTYVDDRNNFYNPVGHDYDIPVPSGMSSSQFDAAVIARGTTYSLPAPYELWGPNSNTGATSIITNAGGVVPDVPNAPAQYWNPPSQTSPPESFW